ncbi:transcriptional regulator [Kitasatospora sp. NPDC088351]|uniref:transcriptional regulator n=1 Tax=Kitasatospora sp. NPDC088351 TaxID=3155180 RepID=UPI00343BB7FA
MTPLASADSRSGQLAARLPGSLGELEGPTAGRVELPLHLAWSGLRVFDLGQPRQRMGLYRIVLNEGMREDLPRFLDAGLLVQQWPVLRTLVGPAVRTAWENNFVELAAVARPAAA